MALHYSACYGDEETMKILINAGAVVNARDLKNNTVLHYSALHYSIRHGDAETMKILINAGAVVNARDLENKSASQ